MARKEYTGKLFRTYIDSEKAWELIEQKTMGYEVDMDILYPDHFNADKNLKKYTKAIEGVLLEEEQHHFLSGICDGYAITSYGRVFNVKHVNQVMIYISKTNVKAFVRTHNLNLSTEFMNLGWSFSINDIKRIYNNYKWTYQCKGIKYNINLK